MGDSPGIHSPGEQPLQHYEDAGILRVVVDQRPVELPSAVVFPAFLALENLRQG